MKRAGRELWEDLADRSALGAPLRDEEHAELRRLAVRYEDCAREHEFYDTLANAIELAKPEAAADDRLIRRTLGSIVPVVPRAPAPKRLRSYAVAAFVSLLSAAAAAAVWVVVRDLPPPIVPAEQATAQARVASGGGWLNGVRVSAGARLDVGAVLATRDEAACVELERGVVACASPGSELCVTALGRHQELELSAGRLTAVLDKQPAGTRFSVATRAGTVSAVGTLFGVEAQRDGSAVVRVEEGAIVARTRELELLVREGQQFRLGADRVESLRLSDFDRDLELLAAAPGGKDNAARAAEARAALTRQVTSSPSKEAETAANAPAPREPSAAEWLQKANEARVHGAFARAAQHYERVIAKHGSSAEARAALVALADLQLSKLGRPALALTLYERYLSASGSLAPEARFGKIQALRALGRFNDERREIAAFLQRHPTSAYASSLTKRLESP